MSADGEKEKGTEDRSGTSPAPRAISLGRNLNMVSRVLYSNPVCVLTARGCEPERALHAMVVSWLTPIDNRGNLFLSINKRRNTVQSLVEGSTFGRFAPFFFFFFSLSLIIFHFISLLFARLPVLLVRMADCGFFLASPQC
jgi:hypothetical protein